MPTKNEVFDRILARLGRPGIGQTRGSTGYKDALIGIVSVYGLPLDTRLPKPELAERIAALAGEPWREDYDSRATVSGGGSTVTVPGWLAVERALTHLEERAGRAEMAAIENVASNVLRGRPSGAGHVKDAKRKRAVEEHAVAVATRMFEERGYAVEDVGATEPFDLLCTRDGDELRVEVKGTTSLGSRVVLTRNEVDHARSYDNVALVVVHSINVDDELTASGGAVTEHWPWAPLEQDLTPVAYRYRVP